MKLEDIVGKENVLTSKEERICYSYDAQIEEALPDAVVIPENTEQISEILKLANREGIPVVPRGSGTGLSGGSVPVKGGIVLLLKKLNKIIEIDRDNLLAVVEPGVVTGELFNRVDELGLMYPPYPSSYKTSTIGGNVATNAGGLRGLKYGVTKDYVLALEVVSPTGEILKTGSRTVKSVTGYDLTRLIVGSEGTLGIITSITLKLLPKPELMRSMFAVFDDITQAAKTVTQIVNAGVIPSTLEIMDNTTINAVEDFKKIGMPKDADAVLIIETDGIKEAAEKEAERVMEICKENGAISIKIAKGETERKNIWEARASALPALARIRPTTILEDATVPRSKITEMITAVQEIAEKYQIKIGTFGHAGDGNLHPTILTDEKDAEEMERVENAIEEIFKKTLSLGGTLTGEHGIGVSKARFLKLETGDEALEIMKGIKRTIDPNNILNPGKIFS
ncbi:MAG: FAD-linked oxidase C-terminal domain-containing protein [Candidatus Hydrothermarchaeaceae archaeon]